MATNAKSKPRKAVEHNDEKKTYDFSQFANVKQFKIKNNLKKSTVINCIEEYIANKSTKRPDIKQRCSQLLMHMHNIQKTERVIFYPEVINEVFWTNFHDYLGYQGLAGSTINNLCGRLSAILKWSANYGASLNPAVNDCYTANTEARPKISLSQDEISRITYFDIDTIPVRPQLKKTLTLVRDQFVISCYIGQRYSDIKRIDAHCFNDNIFRIIQQKTGNIAVVDFKKMVQYPSVIKRLLEKYNYCAPYPHDISMYNKYLHMLFMYAGFTEDIIYNYKQGGRVKYKIFKKYELISSHTARRSMITNAVERGINTEIIRRASGHRSESAFSKYIIWNND